MGSRSCLRSFRSATKIISGEAPRIGFQIALWIEGHAVKQGFRFVVFAAVLVTQFLHRLGVNVRSHHLPGDTLVIGGAGNQTPTTILGEEPFAVFGLREVAIPATENHVVVVLLFTTIAIIVVSLQASEYRFV